VAVTYAPKKWGLYQLDVWATDQHGVKGDDASWTFNVARSPAEVGLWHMPEDDPGHDSSTQAPTNELNLHGASWDKRGRLGLLTWPSQLNSAGTPEGSLALDGGSDYAATTGPALNTSQSFTVSAEAFLTDPTVTASVVSQADEASGVCYDLFYSTSLGRWVFSWHWPGGVARAMAATPMPQPADVWTDVAGVYTRDDAAHTYTLTLYVNGTAQGSTEVPTDHLPVDTQNAMNIGRAWVLSGSGGPGYGDYFPGLIDEVHVWQQAQLPETLQQDAEENIDSSRNGVAQVADWRGDEGIGTTVPDRSFYQQAPMTLHGDAELVDGGVKFSGNGSMSTPGPVVDETGGFTMDVTFTPDVSGFECDGSPRRGLVVGEPAAPGADDKGWGNWFQLEGFQAD
jgi:hypothetical protein